MAAADTYTTTAGRALTVAAAEGVLANDADVDAGDTLGAALVEGPTSGTLDLIPEGSFTYTPARGFLGAGSFSYVATDAAGAASVATTVTTSVLAGGGVTPPTRGSTVVVLSEGTIAIPGPQPRRQSPVGRERHLERRGRRR